jgi:hypothetical protein
LRIFIAANAAPVYLGMRLARELLGVAQVSPPRAFSQGEVPAASANDGKEKVLSRWGL